MFARNQLYLVPAHSYCNIYVMIVQFANIYVHLVLNFWVRERTFRPLVGFGVLIDNTIKGLTYLCEIMSRYLIYEMI